MMALECVHDMAQPVRALGTMRRLVRRDGVVFILDERVADRFDPDAGGVELLMYGISVLPCLPAGRAEAPSVATGTVMRSGTLRAYARACPRKTHRSANRKLSTVRTPTAQVLATVAGTCSHSTSATVIATLPTIDTIPAPA